MNGLLLIVSGESLATPRVDNIHFFEQVIGFIHLIHNPQHVAAIDMY